MGTSVLSDRRTGGGDGFTDDTKSLVYKKLVNLEGAEDGEYTLDISGKSGQVVRTVQLQTDVEESRKVWLY